MFTYRAGRNRNRVYDNNDNNLSYCRTFPSFSSFLSVYLCKNSNWQQHLRDTLNATRKIRVTFTEPRNQISGLREPNRTEKHRGQPRAAKRSRLDVASLGGLLSGCRRLRSVLGQSPPPLPPVLLRFRRPLVKPHTGRPRSYLP